MPFTQAADGSISFTAGEDGPYHVALTVLADGESGVAGGDLRIVPGKSSLSVSISGPTQATEGALTTLSAVVADTVDAASDNYQYAWRVRDSRGMLVASSRGQHTQFQARREPPLCGHVECAGRR